MALILSAVGHTREEEEGKIQTKQIDRNTSAIISHAPTSSKTKKIKSSTREMSKKKK